MSCPDCFTGHIHTGTPKGKIEDLHGYKTYVTLPTDNATPKSTIVFFCDAFGLNLVNNKLLADHYAMETGCRVVAPDVFIGGACSLTTMNTMNEVLRPIGAWYNYLNPLMYLGKTYNAVIMLSGFVPFTIRSGPAKVYPECLRFTREVRAAMPSDGKLGVAGFCWGGYPSTKLCCEPIKEGGDVQLIDAQFCAHPSALNAPDDVVQAIEKFKVPYSCAVAEFDFLFNKDVADQTEAAVRQKLGDGNGVYEFVLHKDCHHGFSVRASLEEDSVAKRGYEDAAKQAVAWFKTYLK